MNIDPDIHDGFDYMRHFYGQFVQDKSYIGYTEEYLNRPVSVLCIWQKYIFNPVILVSLEIVVWNTDTFDHNF